MFAFHSSLLCMFVGHDAVGARQVGGTEMQEHREVSRLITGSEAQRCSVKFVSSRANPHATVSGDIQAWWGTQCISRYCSFNAPSPHRNEVPGAENSGSENTSPTVKHSCWSRSNDVEPKMWTSVISEVLIVWKIMIESHFMMKFCLSGLYREQKQIRNRNVKGNACCKSWGPNVREFCHDCLPTIGTDFNVVPCVLFFYCKRKCRNTDHEHSAKSVSRCHAWPSYCDKIILFIEKKIEQWGFAIGQNCLSQGSLVFRNGQRKLKSILQDNVRLSDKFVDNIFQFSHRERSRHVFNHPVSIDSGKKGSKRTDSLGFQSPWARDTPTDVHTSESRKTSVQLR